jgi:hypothetical protein
MPGLQDPAQAGLEHTWQTSSLLHSGTRCQHRVAVEGAGVARLWQQVPAAVRCCFFDTLNSPKFHSAANSAMHPVVFQAWQGACCAAYQQLSSFPASPEHALQAMLTWLDLTTLCAAQVADKPSKAARAAAAELTASRFQGRRNPFAVNGDERDAAQVR